MSVFAEKQNHSRNALLNIGGSAQPTATHLRRLHRTIGNQAVKRLLQAETEPLEANPDSAATNPFEHASPIQRKAIVSSPGDSFEREAEDVADGVLRMGEESEGCAPARIQRQPARNEDGKKITTRTWLVPSTHAHPSAGAEAAMRAVGHGGAPLSRDARSYFEPRFGCDFSNVRVHSDGKAAQAARAMQARAYTIGCDIVFGSGEYAPATAQGKRLLAHELTHVAQQRHSATPNVVSRDIIPTDVSSELVGQKFSLRKEFSDGVTKLPAGHIVTVSSWTNEADTAAVFSPPLAGTINVPKRLLEPVQNNVAGVAPYGVGLAKVEQEADKSAANLEAFKKTEPQFKTDKGKQFFAKEVKGLEAEQTRIGAKLNVKLIQATMLNRFDASIKKWVDFYNNQFGFKGKDALDPNLIKSMTYHESAMGTDIAFMNTSTINVIQNRFNLIQAIDSWPEEQLLVIVEKMPSLVTKYHLENIGKDLIKAQVELEKLAKKKKSGKTTEVENARLAELSAQSEPQGNWIPWYRAYPGLQGAIVEFLTVVESGKTHSEDYDFWIRVGVRAVFDKHEKNKPVKSWAEAARAYNGKGPRARKYRDEVVERAEQAVKAEKAGREFVPKKL
jgi:hypothetical protein